MIIDDDTFRLVEIFSPCWLQLGLLVLLLLLLVLSTPSLVSWTLDVIVHTVLGITDVCVVPHDVAVNLRDAFVLIMLVNI
jgi:hypothetical protein